MTWADSRGTRPGGGHLVAHSDDAKERIDEATRTRPASRGRGWVPAIVVGVAVLLLGGGAAAVLLTAGASDDGGRQAPRPTASAPGSEPGTPAGSGSSGATEDASVRDSGPESRPTVFTGDGRETLTRLSTGKSQTQRGQGMVVLDCTTGSCLFRDTAGAGSYFRGAVLRPAGAGHWHQDEVPPTPCDTEKPAAPQVDLVLDGDTVTITSLAHGLEVKSGDCFASYPEQEVVFHGRRP